MPYSKDELKSELLRCYKQEGAVTTDILNSSENNYPTQMTYYNHFGSLRDAKRSVGIIAGYTRDDVISDIQECYERHDEVSTKALNNDDSLVNYQVVYKHFGSISDAVESADINWQEAKIKREYDIDLQYTKEELLQNLEECKESEGDTKTTTIDNFGGPTSQVYRDRFGSLTNARKICGLEESFKGGKNSKVQRLISNADIDDSDAHIYVLKLSVNGQDAYYVGESTSIKDRLFSHIHRTKIQAWAHGPHGKILAPREETNKLNEIEIESIEYTIPLYQEQGESDIDFRRRRKYKEHHEHLSVAIDKNTLEVYGGR